MTQANRRRFTGAGVALAAAICARPGLAAGGPDLSKWLAETTDIPPAQVVMVGPDSVYALLPLGERSAAGEVIAQVRTEPLSDDWAKTHDFASWDAHILFDCSAGRLRVIRSANYPRRNLQGTPKAVGPSESWLTPDPSLPAAKLLAAACRPSYAWPLRRADGPPVAAPMHRAIAPPPASRGAQVAIVGRVERGVQAYAVQLGRGPSEAGAQVALKRARKALGEVGSALIAAVEPSDAPAGKRYTAVLGGLPDRAAAADICRRLKKAGQNCLVRAPLTQAATTAVPPQPADPPPIAASPAVATGAYAIQLARGAREDGAHATIRRAQKVLGAAFATLTPDVELTQLDARRRRYTAVLKGFDTASDAKAACQRLTEAGQNCFTRSAAPAPQQAGTPPGA